MQRYLFLLFLAATILSGRSSSAQSFVTIGTGTTADNVYPTPLGNSKKGARHQFLVKASELAGAGIPAGAVINSLGFNVTALNNIDILEGWSLKVYATSVADPLASNWHSGNLLSYTQPVNYTVTMGWNQFSLIGPLVWDGTSNLVVECCFNNNSTSFNASVTRTTGLTGAVHTRYLQGNLLNVCTNTAVAPVTANKRPNIRFGYDGTACAGVPVITNVFATSTNPLPLDVVTLVANGNFTAGHTFQWQEATSSTGPWTPVAGATSPVYQFTAVATRYYRMEVSCGANTAQSSPVLVTLPPYLAGGVYTLNNTLPTGGSNFNNLAALDSALALMLSGAITVNVAPSSYTGQLILDHPQTTTAKTITINGNGATIVHSSSAAVTSGIITLDSCLYVTINNLVLNGYNTSSSMYATGVLMRNYCENDIINGCTILLDSNSSSTNYNGIIAEATAGNVISDTLTFSNNVINGGYAAISIYAKSASVNNNEVKNFYSTGIYVKGNRANIGYNNIHRLGRTVLGDFMGIRVDNSSPLNIDHNKVHDPATANPASNAALVGIFLNNCTLASNYGNWVTYNVIYNMTGTGDHVYFKIYNSYDNWVKNNTVTTGTYPQVATGRTSGVVQDGAKMNVAYNDFNIARNSGALKLVYDLPSSPHGLKSHHNNVRISGPGYNWVGFRSWEYQPYLNTWEYASEYEGTSSISIDPHYANEAQGDVAPTNPVYGNNGMGAGTYIGTACSGVPASAIAMADDTVACANAPIRFSLQNAALATGMAINWEVAPASGSSWTAYMVTNTDNTYFYGSMPAAHSKFRAKFTCGSSVSYSAPVYVDTVFYMCYCSPQIGDTIDESYWAERFLDSLAINSSAGANHYTFKNKPYVPGSAYDRHHSSEALNAVPLIAGSSYDLFLNMTGYAAANTHGVWIDYDRDGVFASNEAVINGVFTIPAGVTRGVLALRVRTDYAGPYNGTIFGPCTAATDSHTDDFLVLVDTPTTCTGTPSTFTVTGPANVCPGTTFNLFATTSGVTVGLEYQWQVYDGIAATWGPVAGATAGAYSVTSGIAAAANYRIMVTCPTSGASVTSAQKTVGVFPTGAQITASGSTTICPTSNVTLTATPGASYLWSNGAVTQSTTVSAAASYSVQVTSVDGCISQATPVAVTTKIMPNTVKIKTTGLTYTCAPNTIELTIDLPAGATTGFAHQWNLNGAAIPGATDYSYNAATGGSYSLTVSGGGACTKTSSAKVLNVKPLPVASFTAGGPTAFCNGGQVTLTAPTMAGYTYTWLKDGNINAGTGTSKIFKLAGVYTVVATQNGCKDTADNPVTLVVHALPVADIATSDNATICAGDSVTLEATPSFAGFSYVWKNGTVVAATTTTSVYEATMAGTYKVAVTDTNSCVSKVSTNKVIVKVNNPPTANITYQGSLSIPSNGSIKLNAAPSSGVTWQWYYNGTAITGATTKSYIATVGGDYTVAITKTGCTDMSDPVTVIQSSAKEETGTTSATAMDEVSVFLLKAYPNPVSNILTVRVEGIEDAEGVVYVMDVNGKLLFTGKVTASRATVDMSSYASGMYLVRYKDNEGRAGTVKISKQ